MRLAEVTVDDDAAKVAAAAAYCRDDENLTGPGVGLLHEGDVEQVGRGERVAALAVARLDVTGVAAYIIIYLYSYLFAREQCRHVDHVHYICLSL